jgi:hypothetical protein
MYEGSLPRSAFSDDAAIGNGDSQVRIRLRAGETYFIEAAANLASSGSSALIVAPSKR